MRIFFIFGFIFFCMIFMKFVVGFCLIWKVGIENYVIWDVFIWLDLELN